MVTKRDGSDGRQRGFTLAEMLVVVVVMIALAAVAVPLFAHQKEKADRAIMEYDAANVAMIIANGYGAEAPPAYADGVASYVSAAGNASITVDPNHVVVTPNPITKTVWCVKANYLGAPGHGPGC